MKSPVLSVLVILSITCSLIVQTREECVCQGLGQGTNPCSCSKVAMKAAKVAKPYFDNSNGNALPRFLPIGDLCYPLSTGKSIEENVGKVRPARPGKTICRVETVKDEGIVPYSFDTTSRANSKIYETLDSDSAAAASASSIANSFERFPKSNSGIYNVVPPLAHARLNTEDARARYPTAKATVDSNSADDSDHATGEIQSEFYPADPVSLTLAYRHLRGPNVIYGQRKRYVPEDKLSFGHPTLPTDAKEENKNANVAEERLVTVNEPLVELNLAPSRIVIINSYGRDEKVQDIGLAQGESADRMADNLLTYKDLGYASVKPAYQKTDSYERTVEYERDAIPGGIVFRRQAIGNSPEGSDEDTEIQTLAFERCV